MARKYQYGGNSAKKREDADKSYDTEISTQRKGDFMKNTENFSYDGNLTQEKKRSKRISVVVIILLLLAILVSSGMLGNLGTFTSGIKMMYVSKAGRDYWNASYQYFDGYTQRNLWVNEDGILNIQVETEDGTLLVKVMDEEGNLLFSEENITTQEIEVGDVKKVTVRIEAEKHKGSFSIQCKD